MKHKYTTLVDKLAEDIAKFKEELRANGEYWNTDDPKMSRIRYIIGNTAWYAVSLATFPNPSDTFPWTEEAKKRVTRITEAVTWYMQEIRMNEEFKRGERTLKGAYPEIDRKANNHIRYIELVRKELEKK
jgi:hypothetical protein